MSERLGTLRILMTGAGAPGFPSIFNCLMNNGERDLYMVGVDMNPAANCRTMVDKFYQVPSAKDPGFIDAILEICEKEKIDAVISIVTRELELFAQAKDRFEAIGTKLTVMDYEPLHIANNKGLLLSAMKEKGLPTPGFKIVHTPEELEKAVYDLGYPELPVVVKPTFGNGSRGTRILDANKSRYDQFFNDKPNSQYMRLEELMDIIAERNEIPEMMVMDYLPGPDVSVDILGDNGETVYWSCRQGLVVINSIMFVSVVKVHEEAVNLAKAITKELGLSGNMGFDMMLDRDGNPQLMEINPRLPAGIVNSVVAGINFPYLRVKQVLGEEMPDCKLEEGYMMQLRNEEVLYNPDGTLADWEYHLRPKKDK